MGRSVQENRLRLMRAAVPLLESKKTTRVELGVESFELIAETVPCYLDLMRARPKLRKDWLLLVYAGHQALTDLHERSMRAVSNRDFGLARELKTLMRRLLMALNQIESSIERDPPLRKASNA